MTGWKPVTDPIVLARLDPAARDHLWQADLKALGITDLEGINSARTYQSDPGLELFFQDKPMTLARYPNSGYMHILGVPDADGNLQKGDVTTKDGNFVCDDPDPSVDTRLRRRPSPDSPCRIPGLDTPRPSDRDEAHAPMLKVAWDSRSKRSAAGKNRNDP